MPPVLLNPSRFAAAGGGAGESAFNAAQLAASPLVLWKFDETSGTSVADGSGNSRTLTLSAAISGGGGASLHSDGGGHSLALTQSSGPFGSIASDTWMNVSEITVELIARITSAIDAGNGDELIGRWSNSNWHVWRNGSGNFGAELSNGAGATKTLNSTFALANDTTYHLVMTKNDTNMKLYVDGSEVADLGSAPGAGIRSLASAIQVGKRLGAAGTVPGGFIDSVAIYGAAHTAGDIAARYALL